MIIAFFGPDGAGKTTVAKLLAKYYMEKGFKVAYVRLRIHHMAMYVLIKLLQLLRVIPSTRSPRISHYSMRRLFKQSRFFFILESLNVLLWLIINVKVRLMMNHIIVAERYIPDFLISLYMITSKIDYIEKAMLSRILVAKFVCHDNRVFIHLTANPMVLHGRKKDEELSLTFIRFSLISYHVITNLMKKMCRSKMKLFVIDTSRQSPLQTLEDILKYISMVI